MLRAMDAAVAGLRAHQNKMDVVGHNIANVNTYGFKAQTYTFKEAMYQTSTGSTGNNGQSGGVNAAQFGYGTLMGTIGMDMTASTPTYVGGFNASINGEGFFITAKEKWEDGIDPANFKESAFDYTRVGQFSVDSEGYVVDGNGNFVYGFRPTDFSTGDVDFGDDAAAGGGAAADKPVLVPLRAPLTATQADDGTITLEFKPDAAGGGGAGGDDEQKALQLSNISIDSLGRISAALDVEVTNAAGETETQTKTVYLGVLAIATFQNPNGLEKAGGNYYNSKKGDNTGQSTATIPGGAVSSLMTGYIEASNVDLAKEFADMITTQRGFQANSKMITVSDEMLSDLVAMKR